MENISKIKESCVGCKSCEQSCPKHCISMVENKEGFWYPTVDENSCIECKVCLKKCPVCGNEIIDRLSNQGLCDKYFQST